MKLDVKNGDEHIGRDAVKKEVKRNTTPMGSVLPVISESSAIEPIALDDLSGWR
jgi:hypothetical protein